MASDHFAYFLIDNDNMLYETTNMNLPLIQLSLKIKDYINPGCYVQGLLISII